MPPNPEWMRASRLRSTERGISALKVSFLILLWTALIQAVVVFFTGSTGLLADTLHNFADALTTLPLWVAFHLSRRGVTPRFPYGLRRAEDLAGATILLVILASAGFAGFESIRRLIHPATLERVPWALAGAFIGFLGNEAVARYRIRVGRAIGSAALVADGQHARWDGFTSLAAAAGLLGVLLGYPIADPLAGLLITAAIFVVLKKVGPEVTGRLMDAMEPETLESIRAAADAVPGVKETHQIRARWLGHEIQAELSIRVKGTLTVAEGHLIAEKVRHVLLHRIPHLEDALIHVDPTEAKNSHHDITIHHFEKEDPPGRRDPG